MYLLSEIWREIGARCVRVMWIVVAAVALRWFLEPFFEKSGFPIFLVAVLAGAWVGGLVPSLIGQTLLLFAHGHMFVVRDVEPARLSTRGLLSMGAYYLVGIVVAILSDARRAALRRVAQQNREIAYHEKELQATIAGIGDAVVVVEPQGRIRYLNPAAAELLAIGDQNPHGILLSDLIQLRHDGGPAETLSLTSVIERGIALREHRIMQLLHPNGSQIPVTFTATPVRGVTGQITGAVVIFRDETARYQAEQELQEMNRRKDDFLATLAHELRNPLAPIRTGLQLMKLSGGDPETTAEVHEILSRQTQHMIRLVDDLLDVSRITRGKLQLRKSRIDIGRVVGDAVETMRPLIDRGALQLTLTIAEHLDPIEADPDRLTQITCNLLHNAIKFTPAAGQIRVDVQQLNGEIQVTIADTGRGIPPEHLRSIFEMFNQGLEDKEHGGSGLGIGLGLARRLAELHGGVIEADSEGLNQGSRFCVRLPLGDQQVQSDSVAPAMVSAAMPSLARRVLIADDNEDALRTISLMLESLGSETRVARDGFQALNEAELFRPEIVLLDLGMPRMSGYDAARQLRQQPWGSDLYLIALTGWGQEKDRQRTQAAGFDEHFVKPVDLDVLRMCLERGRPPNSNQETDPAARTVTEFVVTPPMIVPSNEKNPLGLSPG